MLQIYQGSSAASHLNV